MITNDIIDLQEISPDHWRATYQGNYGVYTVKITFDQEGNVDSFSCSCPSNYYPCKHISIVEEAIAERIAKSQHLAETQKTLTVEELLKNVSLQELYDFVVRQSKYNPDLTNAVRLEFAHKLTDKNTNHYSSILREIMEDMYFDYEDYYYREDSLDLEDLYQWFAKARTYLEQQNYHEVILICKACIEEFAEWMNEDENAEVVDYIDPSYQTIPFEIMAKAVASPDVDSKALYDYCLLEMNKDKYSHTNMFDEFHNLLAILAAKINAHEFIALQDSLLEKVSDNSSSEAEKILQREINFYNDTQQPEKANMLIEKNMQIENFRYQIIEKRFAEQNYAEAKRLIEDFIQEKHDTGRDYKSRWDELLLEIAQKENDIPNIRKIAFSFIERNFKQKYFDIYKSTFTCNEWDDALENLLQHYEKNSNDFDYYRPKSNKFSSAAANVLVAEGAAKRLMDYVEKNLSIERIEKYYTIFVDLYPEKTLELFKETINDYVEKNVGRNHYEYVAKLFEQIRKIKNGKQMVSKMIADYKIKYKKRRIMIEILCGS